MSIATVTPPEATATPMLRPTIATPSPARTAPVPAGPPAIEARDFRFSYGEREVLHGITLKVPRQATTAIIGPSGCGKSTFLRAVNRMHDLQPRAVYGGDILLDGKSIFGRTDLVELRLRVGMVFQRPNPFPKSIYDNVAYGPALNRLAAPRDLPGLVERCLRQAALWDEVKDRLDAPATSLSGGQQQRLCIARALGNQPSVLLMDEPCSALDPVATQRIEELLVELKAHYTIVIVTHNMQQAARASDYTGFFLKGDLVEFGETAQIFTRPAREETEAYITGRFG